MSSPWQAEIGDARRPARLPSWHPLEPAMTPCALLSHHKLSWGAGPRAQSSVPSCGPLLITLPAGPSVGSA